MLRALWPYLARHRHRVVLAVVLLATAKLATVAVPFALKLIVDAMGSAAPDSARHGASSPAAVVPVFLLLGYAALRFLGTLFGELRDLVFSRVSHTAMADLHARVFAHLLALGARYHLTRETGRLAREVERGIAGIGFLLGVGLFTVVPTLIEIAAVLGILAFSYRLEFAVAVIVTFIAYTGFTVLWTNRREVHQRAQNDLDARTSGRLVDTLLNYESVKSHASESLEADRYRALLADWRHIGVRNQKALSALHIGQSAIIACGVAAVMVMAGFGVASGGMTVGDLVLVNTYVIQICLPLNALGFVFRQARDAMIHTEKLLEILEETPETRDSSRTPLRIGSGEVRFERVSFGYEPRRPLLADISLRIAPGHTVAVVGGSGSGKSTLARLLMRFYDVNAGAILIDGQDIRDVTQQSLRSAIGIVPQDTVLFNDTIAYNIGYGRSGARMPEVVAAAKAAHVHELIQSLPQGYDTVVGERGVKLSGGEKQRIAIARVILRNPTIVVFDEATSALDARAERAIQSELDRLAAGRTSLVIAHRLSTIVGADEIVVLERGRIAERGSHDELIARPGAYAQMWALQQQEQALRHAEGAAIVRQLGERRRNAAA